MQKKELSVLLQELNRLDEGMMHIQNTYNRKLKHIPPHFKTSAINLIQYLYFRSHNRQMLQENLHRLGLSSLASSESHIHKQVQSILKRLGKTIAKENEPNLNFERGSNLLQHNAEKLFGKRSNPHIPAVMVTYETQLADNPDAIREMLLAGMQVARINCAHDSPEIWLKMIQQTKAMSKATKKPCKIYIDLAGPKIRTHIAGKGSKKGRMKVQQDDIIYLTDDNTFADENIKIVQCTLKGIIQQLQTGNRVFFDDGKIAAKVQHIENNTATLLVTRCRDGVTKLANEKGINFPDTDLNVVPLTAFDKKCIPFAVKYADLIGYSFVRNASDIRLLKKEILKSGNKMPHLVFKIETLQAVNNLPALLLEGMKENYFGVMIARGDLALEIGFERLSEIQEEILWICEAAHTPVIWATQVLESLNKSGLPTRAEITDASHASFAECVMLNKGVYMREVLESLHSILKRTGSHRLKKRYIFRSLSIAENFMQKVH